ncbi:MAG TPA: hypothetical protein VN625_08790, partial [Desulfuromonadaceae bacterium]|nr:hypothetical protein [Desulfuromonadaceae bacterium]
MQQEFATFFTGLNGLGLISTILDGQYIQDIVRTMIPTDRRPGEMSINPCRWLWVVGWFLISFWPGLIARADVVDWPSLSLVPAVTNLF